MSDLDLILTSNVNEFLTKRGNGSLFESAPWLYRTNEVDIAAGTKVRVPMSEFLSREFVSEGTVALRRVQLSVTLTANQMERHNVTRQLLASEQRFIDMMNRKDEGVLHLFRFSNEWSWREWAGRMDFTRTVSAIKELQ